MPNQPFDQKSPAASDIQPLHRPHVAPYTQSIRRTNNPPSRHPYRGFGPRGHPVSAKSHTRVPDCHVCLSHHQYGRYTPASATAPRAVPLISVPGISERHGKHRAKTTCVPIRPHADQGPKPRHRPLILSLSKDHLAEPPPEKVSTSPTTEQTNREEAAKLRLCCLPRILKPSTPRFAVPINTPRSVDLAIAFRPSRIPGLQRRNVKARIFEICGLTGLEPFRDGTLPILPNPKIP